MGKINVVNGPSVELEGGVIRWDNHTCLISAISQIWIGRPNEGKWGLAKEAESEGLNIELNSGSAYSFLSDEHDFLVQVYELFCKTAETGSIRGLNTIDFEQCMMELYEEPEEPEETVPEPVSELKAVTVYTGNNLIKHELEILTEHCRKKENEGTAVLQLLKDIGDCYDGVCRVEVLELYKMFVQLSLINDCNELGLNALIEEVKSHVFHV